MTSTLWRGLALALVLAATPAFAQDQDEPTSPVPPGAPAATAPAPSTAAPSTAAPASTSTAVPVPASAPAAPPATGTHDFSVLPDIDAIVHVPDAAKPQAGKPLDVEAATQAYLDEIPADAKARSDSYFEGGYILIVVEFVYALVVAAIFLWGRLSANFRDRAHRWTRFRWLQTLIYAVQYLIVGTILGLPLEYYESFYREHQYGMSNQTVAGWATDTAITSGIGVLMLSVFLVIFYAVIRWTKSRWWIWATVLSIVFFAFQVAISPVFLEPSINHFTPLADGPLKEQILSMARGNGVPATNVWEFNASKQTTRMSAHVSGFMGTTQVSLNDNLVRRGSISEVRAVMGHELGHYVLRHTWLLLTDFAVLLLIAFAFVNWAFNGLIRRFGAQWRVSGIDDEAGAPLIYALFAFLIFVGTPVLNSVVRNAEYQADIFGLNAAREPDGFAISALKLGEYRKLDPQPWEEFIFYDHPSGRSRIHMAMQWKAEHPNETPPSGGPPR